MELHRKIEFADMLAEKYAQDELDNEELEELVKQTPSTKSFTPNIGYRFARPNGKTVFMFFDSAIYAQTEDVLGAMKLAGDVGNILEAMINAGDPCPLILERDGVTYECVDTMLGYMVLLIPPYFANDDTEEVE